MLLFWTLNWCSYYIEGSARPQGRNLRSWCGVDFSGSASPAISSNYRNSCASLLSFIPNISVQWCLQQRTPRFPRSGGIESKVLRPPCVHRINSSSHWLRDPTSLLRSSAEHKKNHCPIYSPSRNC